jgi:hypothetical protein
MTLEVKDKNTSIAFLESQEVCHHKPDKQSSWKIS